MSVPGESYSRKGVVHSKVDIYVFITMTTLIICQGNCSEACL